MESNKIKLHVLDLGKIVMLADNPVVNPGGGEEAPAIPVHAFLIETPIGKILFDTGCHPEAMKGAWPEVLHANPYVCEEGGTILERLASVHVKPEDIDYVVLSHLHLDHAGCLYPFTNAKVYVQKFEWKKTMEDYKNGSLDFFHLECDVKNWLLQDREWILIDSEDPVSVCEGVKILDLKKGHSFGMLALHVELESGNYLLVSDAAYAAEHYGPPAKLSGEVYDEPGYFAAMEKIRSYAEEQNAKVLFGHDMEQYLTLKKAPDGHYE